MRSRPCNFFEQNILLFDYIIPCLPSDESGEVVDALLYAFCYRYISKNETIRTYPTGEPCTGRGTRGMRP